ncbi:hypothetical protein ACP4OV_031207 [Aristida adscensionis]
MIIQARTYGHVRRFLATYGFLTSGRLEYSSKIRLAGTYRRHPTMAGRRACNCNAAAVVVSAITAAVTLVPVAGGAALSSWEPQSDGDYRLFVMNRLPANMHLSCYASAGDGDGDREFYHSFRADPDREEALPFLSPAAGCRVTCKWACDGNYLRGVTLFSARWPEAASGACTRRGGGCTVMFGEDREVHVVERARGGRGRLLGDLPEHQCEKVLLVFDGRCWYKEHRHPYVGTLMHGIAEYMMA